MSREDPAGQTPGPVVTFPSAVRRHARTLAAPAESPSTSSTRASGRHAEEWGLPCSSAAENSGKHLTPRGPPSGRTTGM
ncbi:hypothetical protein E6R18_33145 [Streptomyces sp. A1277]|nr:hypothetical protein E6R18_33145 [Streptomyces sp. A1277]